MPPLTAQTSIDKIDRQIDRLHFALRRAVRSTGNRLNPMSAGNWQKAWDRFPRFTKRNSALFSRRYEAQCARDQALAKEAKAKERAERKALLSQRPTSCPTCGQPVWNEAHP